jgi:hypothetical protein
MEHIQDMIQLYLEELKEMYIFEKNKPFPIFIMEKPNVNRVVDKQITKDGIHMIIGIQMDHTLQMMLRDKMINVLEESIDIPIINTWESVVDKGISQGCTNWQLYGSRKPGHEAYEFTQHYIISYDSSDGNFMMDEAKVADFNLKKNFAKLSVQYDGFQRFEMNPKISFPTTEAVAYIFSRNEKAKVSVKFNSTLAETLLLSSPTLFPQKLKTATLS